MDTLHGAALVSDDVAYLDKRYSLSSPAIRAAVCVNGDTRVCDGHLLALVALHGRRDELIRSVEAGVSAGGDREAACEDHTYREGRVKAISATIDYSIAALTESTDDWDPIPEALGEHARRAARAGVRPWVLVRGYLMGLRQFMDLLVDGIRETQGVSSDAAVAYLRVRYRSLHEHILASVEHEYQRAFIKPISVEDRARIVSRILAGSSSEAEMGELDYPIHVSWHVGAISLGQRAPDLLHDIACRLGLALLAVTYGEMTLAWLGSRRLIDPEAILDAATASPARDAPLAIGSPLNGLDGFRRTHHEAQAALLHLTRLETNRARYSDSPLVTAALENETLAGWLKRLLDPFLGRPDGGVALLEALRAYIDAGLNYRAAGAALRRDRHTIENHVRAAEVQLGRPVRSCVAELDTALRLHRLEAMYASSGAAQWRAD